jgi:zinc transport system ATP-binding protein
MTLSNQSNSPPMISFNNVTFSYDRLPVIEKANFEVAQGEFIGIIGPNGGGKTTALKLMLRFLKPTSGTVSLKGSVGYVPQTNSYDKQFPITVEEVVMTGCLSEMNFFGKYSKKAYEKGAELLKRFGLYELRNLEVKRKKH